MWNGCSHSNWVLRPIFTVWNTGETGDIHCENCFSLWKKKSFLSRILTWDLSITRRPLYSCPSFSRPVWSDSGFLSQDELVGTTNSHWLFLKSSCLGSNLAWKFSGGDESAFSEYTLQFTDCIFLGLTHQIKILKVNFWFT